MIFSPENAAKEYGAAFIDDNLGNPAEIKKYTGLGCILDKDGVKTACAFTYLHIKA